jgi:hypothetical protein
MSFANVDRFVGVRNALFRRPPASSHARPRALRGRRGFGRWWYTASRRQRGSFLGTAAAATAVLGVVASQLATPFWWASGGSAHLSRAQGPADFGLSALPATMSQQTLWGLITGQPGAAPAVVPTGGPSSTASAAPAAPAPASAAPATGAAVLTVARVAVAAPAPPVAAFTRRPAVSAAPATPTSAPTPAAERGAAQLQRNLVSSGAAKLLCANNPPEVERLGLGSYCAGLAATAAGTVLTAVSTAHGGAASLARLRAVTISAPRPGVP